MHDHDPIIFPKNFFFCIIVILATVMPASATLTYRETSGRELTVHVLVIAAAPGGYAVELNTIQPDGQVIRQTFRTAADLSTLAWTFSAPGRQMELDARLHGDVIVLSGTLRGEKVEKKFAAAGAPWNQLFQMGLGPFALSKEKSFQFRSIGTQGPGELKLGKFTVTRQDKENIRLQGKAIAVVHLRIALSGLLSIFWHGDYWYRQSDGRFLRYRGKSGPGGPTVVSELVDEKSNETK